MSRLVARYLLAGLAMLVSAGLAFAMTPTKKHADNGPPVNLEALVPKQFGDWKVDDSLVLILPSPDVQSQLRKIYTQTLVRTYINGKGARVMLSIAYSRVQYRDLQIHVPEKCYPAQGFNLLHLSDNVIRTRFGDIPDKQLLAVRGSRTEPVTYWMIVGDKVARVGWQWRLAQIKYGLTGMIPDSFLVRVSNISKDESSSYALHREYIDAMLGAIDDKTRARFVGSRAT